MASTFKLFADKMGGTAATNYIGNRGEIFYDPTSTTLRISDGVNAGGNEYAMGTGGGTSNRLVSGESQVTLGTDGILDIPSAIRGSTGTTPTWSTTVTGLQTGVNTTVDMADAVFSQPTNGQIVISGVDSPAELNGTWYYQASDPDSLTLYTDANTSTPVDSTTWATYTTGGAIVNQAEGLTLLSGTRAWTLTSEGELLLPTGGRLGYAGMGWTGLTSSEGTPLSLQAPDYTGVNITSIMLDSSQGISLNTSRGSVLFGADLEAPGLPTHYHISKAADNFDLFFGDDSNYVELLQGGGLVIGTNDSTSGQKLWQFGTDGAVTFPTLTVPISDNSNPSGTGQTLKFRDVSQQAIIYGPESTVGVISAQRIIIQGAPGYTGTAGEGGDVYLWAGPGGSADGGGGDIKVRAGQGQGAGGGGYLNFQAGDSATGAGGYINIESGAALTGQGGYVDIRARSGGDVNLYTGQAGKITLNTEGGAWVFGADGISTFPGALSANIIEGRSGTQIGTQWAYATNYLGGADNEGSQGINLVVEPETLAMLAAWESNHIVPWAMQFSGEAPVEVVLMTNYGDRIQVATAISTFHALPVVISSGDYQAATPTSVVLKAATNSWTFNADSSLTFPDASTQAGGALPLAQLKTIVAAAASWTDFQTAIASL